ncbi:hypothetical protein RPMA_17365 [Tardiphaga alba]|uniref:Uncharacterized protein n=1 Tax=Tardiphaga alba TaxID=340268 RepID=A0ABX8A9I8_9BRAD|nr:hypothetical protein [Tardiphaga alba]QUS40403.1 hypothetical protein RPMA_17365 [Tardiphaga alba]
MSPLPASRVSLSGKYHPRCGTEHQHKPAKALIGVALLIVLSFLLYEINGKAHGQTAVSAPGTHHAIAAESR